MADPVSATTVKVPRNLLETVFPNPRLIRAFESVQDDIFTTTDFATGVQSAGLLTVTPSSVLNGQRTIAFGPALTGTDGGAGGAYTIRFTPTVTAPITYDAATGTLALGVVPISLGGTGQITANAAFNALAPSQTGNAGKALFTDGSNTSWLAIVGLAPSGGTTGQVLTKNSNTNYDYAWATPATPTAGLSPDLARYTTTALPGYDPTMIIQSSIALSNSNKTMTPASGTPYNHAFGIPGQYTGKRYFEFVPGSISFCAVGVCTAAGRMADGTSTNALNFGSGRIVGQMGWLAGGNVNLSHHTAAAPGIITIATVDGWVAGNRLCFAVDIPNNLIWFRVNGGNWNASALNNPATGVGGINFGVLFTSAGNGLVFPGMNAGNTTANSMYLTAADFTQAVPSGFVAWAP